MPNSFVSIQTLKFGRDELDKVKTKKRAALFVQLRNTLLPMTGEGSRNATSRGVDMINVRRRIKRKK
uniref:Uncharacterized protein n=1 Tax=Daphnia magna TaxID=35525 RepID=A0A0P6AFL6_9CRUS